MYTEVSATSQLHTLLLCPSRLASSHTTHPRVTEAMAHHCAFSFTFQAQADGVRTPHFTPRRRHTLSSKTSHEERAKLRKQRKLKKQPEPPVIDLRPPFEKRTDNIRSKLRRARELLNPLQLFQDASLRSTSRKRKIMDIKPRSDLDVDVCVTFSEQRISVDVLVAGLHRLLQ